MSDKKKESKCSKFGNRLKRIPRLIKWGVIVVVVVVIMVVAFVSGLMFATDSSSQIKTTKFGLENVGELVTQTAHLTIVKDNKESRKFFNLFEIPFTESRQIFSYDFEVDASVDFSKLSYEVNEENMEIIFELPHAKIYKPTLKIKSLKVYLDSESLFSRIDLNDNNNALKIMEEQCIEDAKKNGILEAADTNAKRLIDGLIKSNEQYKEYTINYKYIGGENDKD